MVLLMQDGEFEIFFQTSTVPDYTSNIGTVNYLYATYLMITVAH